MELRFHHSGRNATTRNKKTKERKLNFIYWVRRIIVEVLFERELDEDYRMGTSYGAEMNRKGTLLELQILHDQATKGNKPGIAKAIQCLGGELREPAQ